jgi:hypothetical protein
MIDRRSLLRGSMGLLAVASAPAILAAPLVKKSKTEVFVDRLKSGEPIIKEIVILDEPLILDFDGHVLIKSSTLIGHFRGSPNFLKISPHTGLDMYDCYLEGECGEFFINVETRTSGFNRPVSISHSTLIRNPPVIPSNYGTFIYGN